jgi:hypothetical protein
MNSANMVLVTCGLWERTVLADFKLHKLFFGISANLAIVTGDAIVGNSFGNNPWTCL